MVRQTTVCFPATQRPRLRTLLARIGTTRASSVLGASLPALERAAGGLPVRYGTALAIQQALDRLPTSPTELAKVVAAARAHQPGTEVQP